MNRRLLVGLCAAVAWLPAIRAQDAPQPPFDPTELQSQASDWAQVQDALQGWRARHGESWRSVYDQETGRTRFLFGGAATPPFTPRSDADFFSLARFFLEETRGMHGLDGATLAEDRVTFLPLAVAGSTDKVTVQFRQQVAGVPVVGGFATALFDLGGRLLSVDTTGLPAIAGLGTSPAVDAGDALDAALARFAGDTGLPPTEVYGPRLVIDQMPAGKERRARLAWEVEVHFSAADSAPEGYVYRFDARDKRPIARENAVHHLDVSGTVQAMATPGLLPDGPGNPETAQPMAHLRVTSPQGNATTDSNGNFTIAGATAPLNVTVQFNGSFCNANNQAQADYTLNQNLTAASGNQILMNPASADLVTAEANAFHWISLLRDWTRAINPADATMDFLATANVNLSQTCNAFFNGSSVNFYRAGGGCANTAYSTVVVHEMGHWLNVRYNSGNGPDGFGEGNSDVFAMYIADDPIVARDFCGPGCFIRTGNNNRQFCGDCCGGCHGGVHADGEVLMGALWKVRARLKNTHGTALGGLIADTLFNSWMNAYNDSQIKTIIETHWLTLDDDDGNINNGTPNYADIDGGFRQQGFPGFDLSFVDFQNVTILGNTQDEVGPYTVNADITPVFNPPVTQPELLYRVNGGSFVTVPMTLAGGDTYTADIPGQVSPAKVEYYLIARDGSAQSNSFPADAPDSLIKFIVGIERIYFAADFESGVAGWTHGTYNGTQDDWQLSSQVGAPNGSFGKSGDPTSAVSGTNIWGNDLGPSGWNGAYQSGINNFLRSPAIDMSQATGTILRFKRWLTVESGQFDQARVRVNGAQVWVNPNTGDLLDSSWQDVEIDVSAIADGNPSVQIEFGLQSDSSVVFGGWNIDDVELVSIDSVCAQPVIYCQAKVNSLGQTPAIGFNGSPRVSTGDFELTCFNGSLGNKNGIVFWSNAGPASQPFFGGTLCAQFPLQRGTVHQYDAFGFVTVPVAVTPAMVGTTRWFQFWFRDPQHPDGTGVGLSEGVEVQFCN